MPTPPVPRDGDALRFVMSAPLGARVVIRSVVRTADGTGRSTRTGYRDALGYLRGRTEAECTVETKRGLTTVRFDDIVLAKAVPPPPRPRPSTPGPTG